MKGQYTNSTQNRFTAYLVTAVTNKRIRYLMNRSQLQEREYIQTDFTDKGYVNFDRQFWDYIEEKSTRSMSEERQMKELSTLFEEEQIIKILGKLKERERSILFARVFDELTFAELGSKFSMEPKQAEMAYYYVIRKIRKKLEGKKNGF